MRHLISLLFFALPFAASAQVLTEAAALRLGLSISEVHTLERGTRELAEADSMAAALWPNPTLDYSRERMRGVPGASGVLATVDETWQIAQTFDISGRRGLRQEAAARRFDATVASNSARRGELAAEILRRFHEVLRGQLGVRATETWAQRFTRIAAIVDKLARGGEASGYDRRRLAHERQTAEARLTVERAALDRNRTRLAALLGKPGMGDGEVVGTLLPPPLPALDTALAALEQRPDLLMLSRRADAADLERRAAARGWVPDITLGVGAKRSDNGIFQDNGAIVTLSIPLPLFDRQQAEEKRAAAAALNARAEYGLARSRAAGEVRGLQRQLEQLAQAATAYRATAIAASTELLRIAEAAYQGGESTVLELLDAYRGALEAELTALDLEWKAREARIDHDLLTGRMTE